eukprot:TRINITY_DN7240_c0_g1_i2.p1 TRINITY_DN7240_c0_g1~~TRINITY_DN7240_c0_g1_i2.p1  ORF type:complete len:109 (+),score=28.57 TRINITY_DN7240_c0_g1_i2:382-708(+)
MSSSSSTSPIHSLLAAEEEAQGIVSRARSARQQKLKLAKEEAEKEMALYRAKKEEEFRSKLEGLGDEKGLRLQQLDEITAEKSKEMWNLGQSTVGDVSDWLLKLVMTV